MQSFSQKSYLNTEKGKNVKVSVQHDYLSTGKGKNALSNAQKLYYSTSKSKRAKHAAQKSYSSSIKGVTKIQVFRSSTKGKMSLQTAQKTYFSTAKGMHNKHKANKKYYDSIHSVDSLETSDYSQSTPNLASYNSKDCNEQHPIDNDIVNPNSDTDSILQCIRDHIASSAVCNRHNKDIAKKLGSNRKTVNPPLSVIAPSESCHSIFKNMHYQPLNHTKSQALVKFIFHAKTWLKSEFLTMTNSEIKDKFSDLYPNLTLHDDNKVNNVDYSRTRTS